MLFQNFMIREFSLTLKVETKQKNLWDLMEEDDESLVATAFAIDKELGVISVTT